MYVAKLIDRENPEHGVKFWRFNHHYKNAGTFDKINAAFSALPQNEDPFSTTNGRDMIISISRDGNNSVVTGINFDFTQTPLSSDAEQAAAWKADADEKTWRDVYSVKPYDYLEIVVRGGSPVWQKNESGEGGKWVDKASLEETTTEQPTEEFDSELTMGANPSQPTATSTAPVSAAPQTAVADEDDTDGYDGDDDEDDDLPF